MNNYSTLFLIPNSYGSMENINSTIRLDKKELCHLKTKDIGTCFN